MGSRSISHSLRRVRRAAPVAAMALLIVAITLPLLSLPASAVQENDPEIQQALARMNRYRGWLGLAPMSINPSLQAASEAHAEYYRLNFGDPNLAGLGLHRETPELPGFTGETMRDRARAQGYEGSVNENAGLSGSMLWSLDWFMDTINHRLPIIDPRYTDVGMATVNDGDIVFEVIMFGMPSYRENAEPAWVIWPPDGTTGVGRSFWGEAPNPFPGATFPTGLPVTMSFFGGGAISLDSWSISANGQDIPSFGGVGSGFLSGRAALITAAEPLEYGTTYTITASGMAGGESFNRSWSFTTETESGEEMSRGDEPPEPGDQPAPTATPVPGPTPTSTPAEPPPADIPDAPPAAAANVDSNLPTGLSVSPPSIQQLWGNLDGAVHNDTEARSWLLGTDVWALGTEAYAEAPGEHRDVYYFDKARVEVAEEAANTDVSLLTAGLLVRDMILGAYQVGDSEFVEIGPADIPLAGDPAEFNENAPTYASLSAVATASDAPAATPKYGRPIVQTIDRNGGIGENGRLGDFATYGSFQTATGHNIALEFESYFATLPVNWWELVGLPITEPFWMRVMVSEEPRWVLVQAFERRILTYTPSNEPEWRVEMGNVGRHYYAWRYGVDPPGS